MLTHICLENFKTYKQRIELQLAPITLLYGPNSSGKSSILQAMLYAYEVISHDWLDVDHCSLSPIDLGGFSNVLNHSAEREEITIGLGYTLQGNLAASKAQTEFGKLSIEALESYEYHPDCSVSSPNGEGGPNWGYVEFTVAWNSRLKHPYISRLSIYLQSGSFPHYGLLASPIEKQHHVLDVISSPSRQQVYISNINFEHDLFLFSSDEHEQCPLIDLLSGMGAAHDTDSLRIHLNNMKNNAKPVLGKALELELMSDRLEELDNKLINFDLSSNISAEETKLLEQERRQVVDNINFLTELFSQLIITPLHHLSLTLEHMAHIGPWRDIPERNFSPSRSSDSRRWHKGIAAWDEVYQCDQRQFDTISKWMQWLKTGYAIEREEINKRSAISKSVVLKDSSGHAMQPADVGVGISQLFPIVVAACSQRVGVVAVEQPELHIHPALQVELGDLFCAMASLSLGLDDWLSYEEYITGAMGPAGNKFLVETHSEHMLLRLLRRIRDTDQDNMDGSPYRLHPHEVSVLYIDVVDGVTIAKRLHIDDEGEFIDKWPKGFFAERAEELF